MCVYVFVEIAYIHNTCTHAQTHTKHFHLSTLIISIESNHKNLLSLAVKYHNGIAQSSTINYSAQGLPIVGIRGLWQVRFLEHCQSSEQEALTTLAGAVNKGLLHLYSSFHPRVSLASKGTQGSYSSPRRMLLFAKLSMWLTYIQCHMDHLPISIPEGPEKVIFYVTSPTPFAYCK